MDKQWHSSVSEEKTETLYKNSNHTNKTQEFDNVAECAKFTA